MVYSDYMYNQRQTSYGDFSQRSRSRSRSMSRSRNNSYVEDDCEYDSYQNNTAVVQKSKRDVIRLPTPPPIVKQVVERASTPEPEIVERIFVRPKPQQVIEKIIERPRTPPPRIVIEEVDEKAPPKIVRTRIVRVDKPTNNYMTEYQYHNPSISYSNNNSSMNSINNFHGYPQLPNYEAHYSNNLIANRSLMNSSIMSSSVPNLHQNMNSQNIPNTHQAFNIHPSIFNKPQNINQMQPSHVNNFNYNQNNFSRPNTPINPQSMLNNHANNNFPAIAAVSIILPNGRQQMFTLNPYQK